MPGGQQVYSCRTSRLNADLVLRLPALNHSDHLCITLNGLRTFALQITQTVDQRDEKTIVRGLGDQADKVMSFGLESHGFESSGVRPTSPLSSLLFAAAILKNEIFWCFLNKESKRKKMNGGCVWSLRGRLAWSTYKLQSHLAMNVSLEN